MRILTDEEIAALISEPEIVPINWFSRLETKDKTHYQHKEKDSTLEYILLRYNGKHPSKHTNKWEKENGLPDHTFAPAFHIHKATQRYQEGGYKIDGYAEVTTKYSDFHAAVEQFLVECNVKREDDKQASLFEGGGIS